MLGYSQTSGYEKERWKDGSQLCTQRRGIRCRRLQKKSGKNPEGGLNEKGRKSYERENPGSDLKRPSKKVGIKTCIILCKNERYEEETDLIQNC